MEQSKDIENKMVVSSSTSPTASKCCGMCGACGAMPPWAPERVATLSREEKTELETRMLAAQHKFKRERDLRLLRLREQEAEMCPLAARVDLGNCDNDLPEAIRMETDDSVSVGGSASAIDAAGGSGSDSSFHSGGRQEGGDVGEDCKVDQNEKGVLRNDDLSEMVLVNLSSSSSETSLLNENDGNDTPREASDESLSLPSRPLQHAHPPSRRMQQESMKTDHHATVPTKTTGRAVVEKARERRTAKEKAFASISQTTDADFDSDTDSFHTAGSDDDTALPSSADSASNSNSNSNSYSPSIDEDEQKVDSNEGYVLIGNGDDNDSNSSDKMDKERLDGITEDVNNAFADFSQFERAATHAKSDVGRVSTNMLQASRQIEQDPVSRSEEDLPPLSSSVSEEGSAKDVLLKKGADSAKFDKFEVLKVDGLGDTISNTDGESHENQDDNLEAKSYDNKEAVLRNEEAAGCTKQRLSASPYGHSPSLQKTHSARRTGVARSNEDGDEMAVAATSADVVQCWDCRKWRRRVQELESNVQTVTTLLAEREMENATLKARLDDRDRFTPRNEARLHQENTSLRVTMEFLSQRLETYERWFKDRKGDEH